MKHARVSALRIATTLTLTVMAMASQAVQPTQNQPNILFIYLDDFGWKDTGFMGSDFFETPHLDKLAREGMVFTNAYSCASNCAPARACLLSGQYTPRHQIFNVGTGPRGKAQYRRLLHVPGVDTLDTQIKTWAQCLQETGYRTATVGKWHLSKDPVPYGFHVNIGGTHSGSPPRGYYPPHGKVPGLADAPAGEYLTDRLNQEAVGFIRANQTRPWMLYLTHFAVHSPFHAKKELVSKYEAKPSGQLHHNVTMATMIQSVDDGVGQIQSTLEALNLTDKTIIVFFSDNGGVAKVTDMAPLRGYKGTYYEGGIREPFFVKWPGVVKSGSTCDVPIIGVDLYPTLCDMAGAKCPKDQLKDGVSLVPLLKGDVDTLPERALFWHFPAYLQVGAGIEGVESRDALFRSRPCSIIRLGDWKLHQYFEDGGLELYNLKRDMGETKNLAQQYPTKRRALLQRLVQWRAEVGAPVPSEPNPAFDAKAEAAALQSRRESRLSGL